MGRGASGSGRFRVGEKVWRGRYKSPPLTSHTLHPALEDGTDRGFRNVGIQQSDAGETPKRIHNRFKTRRKFGQTCLSGIELFVGAIKQSRHAVKAIAGVTFLVKVTRNNLATLSKQVLLYELLYVENFYWVNFIK